MDEDPGAVYQYVYASKLVQRRLHRRLYPFIAAGVGHIFAHLVLYTGVGALYPFKDALIVIGENNGGALPDKLYRRGGGYIGAAANKHCDFILYSHKQHISLIYETI